MRRTVVWLTPAWSAIVRVLQWVCSEGVVVSVASTISAIFWER